MRFIEIRSSCARAAPTAPDDDRVILRDDVGRPRGRYARLWDVSGRCPSGSTSGFLNRRVLLEVR